MERREALKSAGLIAVAAMASRSMAADHDHHMHGAGSKFQPLIEAAGTCIQKGEACLSHCLMLLGDGDKEMAACAKSVNEMMAICRSLESLASQGSRYAMALAKVAMDSCKSCEDECRKHENKHAECKACAESCADCFKQCKALTA